MRRLVSGERSGNVVTRQSLCRRRLRSVTLVHYIKRSGERVRAFNRDRGALREVVWQAVRRVPQQHRTACPPARETARPEISQQWRRKHLLEPHAAAAASTAFIRNGPTSAAGGACRVQDLRNGRVPASIRLLKLLKCGAAHASNRAHTTGVDNERVDTRIGHMVNYAVQQLDGHTVYNETATP